MKGPNFLFLITDQQRADYLGCYGHPILRTPHIDGLAARGTRCERFYVASPVCMPNRASLFTGRYPSVHGLRRNGMALSQRHNTFLDVLRAGGYDTALIGKSHVQSFFHHPPPVGGNPSAGAAVPEAWKDDGGDYLQEQAERYTDDRFDVRLPYYGFDHVDLVLHHGDNCSGHYRRWLRHACPDFARLIGADNQLPHNYTCPQAIRTALPEELYSTSYVRDRTNDYLRAAAERKQPFFAFVSFPDPHHPFTPPGRYWELYDPEDMQGGLPYRAHRNPPPHLAAARDSYLQGTQVETTPKAFMATEQQIREAQALTCGTITMVDDAIGAVLDTLRSTGLDATTVLTFTSDHGDYLGDFDILLKGSAHTQSLVRMPFIWVDPRADTRPVSDALLSTIDIAPSILARADLPPYNGMQGQSFLDTLRGGAPFRSTLLIEHEDNMALWGFEQPAEVRTLVTNRYRASVYRGVDWGEVYDLRDDPRETHNLWAEPEHRELRAELVAELLQQVISAGEKSPWPYRQG